MPGITTGCPWCGCDAAGWVEATGDGVAGWSAGDRVLVDPVQWGAGKIQMIGDTKWGGYAEYVLVDAEQLIALPDGVSTLGAACLPVAYGTAHRMMFTRGQVTGDDTSSCSVRAGASAPAALLAKMVGAHVVAACGFGREVRFARGARGRRHRRLLDDRHREVHPRAHRIAVRRRRMGRRRQLHRW